jgi:ABC-type amino acid transport substrate-binding protein
MRFVRPLAVLAGIVLSSLMATASFGQAALQTMMQSHKLNICWINYPPGGYRDAASGKLQGYYFDIVNEILGQVKVEPNFVESDWSTVIAALAAKKCDMTIAGVLMTISRAAAVQFSRPIFYLSNRLVVRKDETRIASLDDIKRIDGIKLAATQGSSAQDYSTRNFPKASIVALASRDPTAPLLELASGRADAAVQDAWLTEKFVDEHPETLKILGDTFNKEGVGWAYRYEDRELRDFFDVALEKLRLNGTIDAYVRNYPESGRFIADDRIRPVK